jgi:hypothetical protein
VRACFRARFLCCAERKFAFSHARKCAAASEPTGRLSESQALFPGAIFSVFGERKIGPERKRRDRAFFADRNLSEPKASEKPAKKMGEREHAKVRGLFFSRP